MSVEQRARSEERRERRVESGDSGLSVAVFAAVSGTIFKSVCSSLWKPLQQFLEVSARKTRAGRACGPTRA